MKNNVLVVAANSKYSHSSLALRYFRENSGCDIYECSINDNIFDIYTFLCETDYQTMCFSVYIWNVDFVLKLIPMIKNAKPQIRIILGGPEAGYNYKTLLDKYDFIDGVIRGEGEYAISALVSQKDNSQTPNFVYRFEENVVENDVIKVDLSKIKFPYKKTDLEVLKNKIIYFETSRGCCFNCSYCLSSSEGKTRNFDMEYVKQGIKFFTENEVPLVKLVDRTFNENNLRACQILEFINQNNKNTMFHFEIAPQLITEEFAALLNSSKGLVQLEMGIQTINKETMKCINRVFDTEKIKQKIALLPKEIHTHMDLIAGLPKENLRSFIEGFNYVYSLRPDMLQLGFLKLLHNTALKSHAGKYGIKVTHFSPYEVLSTNDFAYEELILLKKVEKAVDRIYNSGAFGNTLQKLSYIKPFELFKKIGINIFDKEKQGPISRLRLYMIMYEIFGEEIKRELVVDFLINNPKMNLPEVFCDKRGDLKEIHKSLAKSEKYKNFKFKIFASCGEIFVVYCDKVDILKL